MTTEKTRILYNLTKVANEIDLAGMHSIAMRVDNVIKKLANADGPEESEEHGPREKQYGPKMTTKFLNVELNELEEEKFRLLEAGQDTTEIERKIADVRWKYSKLNSERQSSQTQQPAQTANHTAAKEKIQQNNIKVQTLLGKVLATRNIKPIEPATGVLTETQKYYLELFAGKYKQDYHNWQQLFSKLEDRLKEHWAPSNDTDTPISYPVDSLRKEIADKANSYGKPEKDF